MKKNAHVAWKIKTRVYWKQGKNNAPGILWYLIFMARTFITAFKQTSNNLQENWSIIFHDNLYSCKTNSRKIFSILNYKVALLWRSIFSTQQAKSCNLLWFSLENEILIKMCLRRFDWKIFISGINVRFDYLNELPIIE